MRKWWWFGWRRICRKNEAEEAKGESARADEELKQVPGLRRGGWSRMGSDVLLPSDAC